MASLKVFGFFIFLCVALVSSVQGLGRIVGGSETTIGKRPYQASLQYKNGNLYSHSCGASIISSKYLLTAAHCNPGISAMYARVGSTRYNTGGQVLKVSKFTPHPSYSRPTLDYDFAIITLEGEIIYNENIADITLTSGSNPSPGSLVTVSGWGVTAETGSLSLVLKEVNLPTVDDSVCRRTYPFLSDRQICLGGTPQGMLSACFGDSGGPAVQNGVQYALVSGGNSCEKPNVPGIYAKVSRVRDWIKQQTGI